MLLQGTIITALLLGVLMAWSAGALVWFAALTAWSPVKSWIKRILLSGLLSAALLTVVVGIDARSGLYDPTLFPAYLIGCMGAAVPAIAYLAFLLLQRKT